MNQAFPNKFQKILRFTLETDFAIHVDSSMSDDEIIDLLFMQEIDFSNAISLSNRISKEYPVTVDKVNIWSH